MKQGHVLPAHLKGRLVLFETNSTQLSTHDLRLVILFMYFLVSIAEKMYSDFVRRFHVFYSHQVLPYCYSVM
jgi:hypothetical protein